MQRDVVHIPRKVAGVIVGIVVVGAALFGYGIKSWSSHTVFGAQAVSVRVAKDIAPVNLGSFANGFSAVIKPALPAVVNIHSSKVVKNRNQMPFMQDPFFKQFFGDQFGQGQDQTPRSEREESLGSGVIVNPDGYVLTNNHVVDGASDVKVQLSDNREFTAKVVGTDPKSDLAVLKIDASNLPTLAFGDSAKLNVGDLVFAIGDPFGVGETATMGIVSATGRGNLQIEQGGYEDFIQTDASINPGNSGGALLDVHGDLIGINTAIITGGGGGNQGIGFAIPVNEAQHVMDQLVEHGHVIRGYLGVYIQPVTPEIAQAFGLKQGGGSLVGDVSSDGPAAKAGLKKGDVILAVNGQPVEATNQLQLQISTMAPGTTVDLKVFRDGTTKDMKVTLGELPAEKSEASNNGGEENGSGSLQGVDVQTITPDIAQQLNLSSGTHGVVVTSVDPSSPAAGELNRGDVIQEVNHKPVQNVNDYRQALSSAGKNPVLLLVNRDGITNYVVVQPSE